MAAVGRIMRQMSLERASILAKESIDLCKAGDLEVRPRAVAPVKHD